MLIPVMYGLMGAYPFLEAWVTGDKREHHLLDRPRNMPVRTALGMAAMTFYGVLLFAASNDIMAIKFNLSINDITNLFRISVFVLPVIVFWATKRICISLQRADRDKVLHGRETARIIRTPEGRFFEAHEPLDEYTRWNLVQHEAHVPVGIEAPEDGNGVSRRRQGLAKLRSRLSHFYFADSIDPVTPAELEAAHHDHGGHDGDSIEHQHREAVASGNTAGERGLGRD
mgnify:FL=1